MSSFFSGQLAVTLRWLTLFDCFAFCTRRVPTHGLWCKSLRDSTRGGDAEWQFMLAELCCNRGGMAMHMSKDWVTAAKGYRAAAEQGLGRCGRQPTHYQSSLVTPHPCLTLSSKQYTLDLP